ncbi:hypothetical protein BCR43DRAFT_493778 [Syncephalastrum racemosum]|uniref:Uncharacterized protein n=1 Tax=Syncephalastrum racemosum TaxID=13706 RepID=A0A1X2HB50_SYNRA|nr:hypothetical protein BCR43DRAFT_493778 [Syncephalastrum racemosum]
MPIKPPRWGPRDYLGRDPSDPVLNDYIKTFDSAPKTVKEFSDVVYHSFKSAGVSLQFNRISQGQSQLDSVILYNAKTKDGFEPYTGEIPFGFERTAQAHEIVSQLGEPDRKGGGGKTHLPCWIEYHFNDDKGGGIMIQLHGVDWDDREMGWTTITVYGQ